MNKLSLFFLVASSSVICSMNTLYKPEPQYFILEGEYWIRAEYFNPLTESLMQITQMTFNPVSNECVCSCYQYTKTRSGASSHMPSDVDFFTTMSLRQKIDHYLKHTNK